MNKKLFNYLNIEISRAEGSAGFVILFAVTISSILLAITLGVLNIAMKEIKFSTSDKDTNVAFLAADTGIEYVLFHDKTPSEYVPVPNEAFTWDVVVASPLLNGCAKVSITKDNTSPPNTTTLIISKGYNVGDVGTCISANPDRIERELKISY